MARAAAVLVIFMAAAPVLFAQSAAQKIHALQEQVRLHPEDGDLRLQLGRALHTVGDLADAEAELREAVNRLPQSAPAQDELRAVLSEMGNGAGAVAPLDTRITVDVRQVLVPVVVTDREGHHVTGLRQQDFKVLEDGVEQTITTFGVEQSGVPQTAAVSAPRSAASTPVAPGPHAAPRRTYLICVDTLHGSFNNFVSGREALKKLFQREHSEDSQYVVAALGTTAEIVLNTTPDPNAVLTVLQSKKFQTLFLKGQIGGLKTEMDRYRRDLNEVRVQCDIAAKTGDRLSQVACDVGKKRVPNEAQFIGELDRTLTTDFLRQFRFLVAQLATAKDRRTIILMSDGFQISPGRQAYELLPAFFPDLRDFSLRSGARLSDEFEPILRLAARNNITIDTIDARGLYGIGSFDASSEGSTITVAAAVDHVDRNVEMTNNETLDEIAKATGGTAFRDSNDLVGALERAFADGRDYYTLGYTSTNANMDGKFRAITVQVRGRELTINAKAGYWSERAAQ